MAEPLRPKCTHKYCCWYTLMIKTLIFWKIRHHGRASALQMYAQILLLVHPDHLNSDIMEYPTSRQSLCALNVRTNTTVSESWLSEHPIIWGSDIMAEPLRCKCTHKYCCWYTLIIKTLIIWRIPHHGRASALQMYAQILLLVKPDHQNIDILEDPTSRQSLCAPNVRTNTTVSEPWLSEHPIIWGSDITAEPLRSKCTHKYCC